MRARVLNIEGEQITLGVYYQGAWMRVWARSQVPLAINCWIEGELVWSQDEEQTVYFRIDEQSLNDTATAREEPSSGSSRLDISV